MNTEKDYSLLRPFDLEAAKFLSNRLSYEQETGNFIWLPMADHERDAKRWNGRYASTVAGSIDHKGYVRITFRRNGKKLKILAHRLAWFFVNGEMPNGQIDHINQIKIDNRISNLRVVSQFENQHNLPMYRNNTSGITGVSWNKECCKWVANARLNGKRHYLGMFDDIGVAKSAVDKFRSANGFTDIHGKKHAEAKSVSKYNSCIRIEWEEPAGGAA